MKQLIPRMVRAECIDEKLKTKDQMAWGSRMNSIRQRVEGIILAERICE